MATSEIAPASLPRPASARRPAAEGAVGPLRRIRRRAGAGFEYLWELSASLRRLRAEARLVEGLERSSGLPLRLLYLGHGENFAFLTQRACSEHRVLESRTRTGLLGVRGWVRELPPETSLLCVDLELLQEALLGTGGFLRVPQWIRQKYAMRESWEESKRSRPSSAKWSSTGPSIRKRRSPA